MSATGGRSESRGESDTSLTEQEIHDVLRNDRRRAVLERLLEQEAPETVAELAEFIAAIEAGTSPPPRNVRQSVYVSLHQTHLPKLDELRIVDYDPEEKEVSIASGADAIAPYLNAAPEPHLTWATFYLAVGSLGMALVVGAVVGVPGLAGNGALLGLTSLAVVVLSAVYQRMTDAEAPLGRR